MKEVKITIKNCKNCCFMEGNKLDGVNWTYDCLAPIEIHKGIYRINSYVKNYKSPKWCPLKKQNLKIEFKK